MSKPRVTRRTFVRSVAIAGAAGPLMMPRLVRAVPPSSKLRLAAIGCAGKGWEDLIASSGDGKVHDVAALCDIDHRKGAEQPGNLGGAQAARPLGIGAAAERFPDAARYADFRRLLDRSGDIDAVTVSTPDHMHATIAIGAMSLGKHVYVQKPLAQTVHEARVMRQVAARQGVVTQMGNQFHTSIGYRCLVDVIRQGAIGKVRQVHAWTSSPNWPQGVERPAGEDPVPQGVHWDLWLGVAPQRPYKKHAYHNFNWRGWQQFGTGSLGDMGCHVLDPVVWALKLGPPRSIAADNTGVNGETYAKANTVRYTFAPTAFTADTPVELTWYDGGRMPAVELARGPGGFRYPSNGSMFIGDKGVLVTAHSPTAPRLYPEADFEEYSRTRVRDIFKGYEPIDHYRDWTDAIARGGDARAASDFAVAGPLAEIVLLGTIAQRLPDRALRWNDDAFAFDDAAATALLRRAYRSGWAIDALE